MMHVKIVCAFLSTCSCVLAIPIDMFYSFGVQSGDKTLLKGFMERSERIRVEGGFNFLGSRFYNVYVSDIVSVDDVTIIMLSCQCIVLTDLTQLQYLWFGVCITI